MKVAVAHSADPNLDAALVELEASLREGIAGEPAVAALIFACSECDHARLLDAVGSWLPGVALIGCTTDGELSGTLGFQEDSITITVIAGHGLRAAVGVGENLSVDPVVAVASAVDALTIGPDRPALVITLPEGLSRCGADVVIGALNERLGPGIPIVGGTAGDQWNFRRTLQFVGGRVLQDCVPLLAIFGDLHASMGVSSGWVPIGHRGTVTDAEGPVVRTIDGVPAMAFYQRYLGPYIEATPEYPLGIFLSGGGQPVLRAPIRSDSATGAITFTGDVPVGAVVQISEAAREDMLDACRRSAEAALDGLEGRPVAAGLVFSCAARKQLLGTRTGAEVEILSALLPSNAPISGFYTYGEIAPVRGRVVADFHNETFVTVLLAPESGD